MIQTFNLIFPCKIYRLISEGGNHVAMGKNEVSTSVKHFCTKKEKTFLGEIFEMPFLRLMFKEHL